jgi:signal transduction histidine kinase
MLPVVLGAGGLVLWLALAAPAFGEHAATTSYASVSPGAALLETLTAATLFAAATLLATDRSRRQVALATFFLGLAWSGDVWAGWSEVPALRAVGMLLVPMVAPALLLVASTLRGGRRAKLAGASVAAITVVAGVVLWLVRDPFLDRYGWRDCLAQAFAPLADAERARTTTNLVLALGVSTGLLTVGLCAAGLTAGTVPRRASAWAVVPGVGAGLALAVSNAVLLVEPAENPSRSLFTGHFVARGLLLVAFAAGLAVVALRPRFVRSAVARLAQDPARWAGQDLAAALSDALGDPTIRIGYPLSRSRELVDAGGHPVVFGDSAIRIVRGGEPVALVDSRRGMPHLSSLDRLLGPAIRLALANERLRAEQLARLHELVATRRRIVATSDAARRRLERDLHDGAQQRLLALSLDLRVALTRAEAAHRPASGAALRDALGQIDRATAELRTIAHGIFPVVLATSGLVAALETLADTHPLRLTTNLHPERRLPPEVELAAYALVAEAAAGARGQVRASVCLSNGSLVTIVDDAPWSGGVVRIEDRVGAAGGTVTRSGTRLEAVLPVPPD